MTKREAETGYSQNGLPYTRFGNNLRHLVIFNGLEFSHKPPSGLMLQMTISSFNRLAKEFTVYLVSRKPRLPIGYTMQQMSDDYATMINEDIKQPVDIMGISTGGPIAQYFAVDHPDLIKHLVLASTGYRLSEDGRQLQRDFGDLVKKDKWRAASALLAGATTSGVTKPVLISLMWLFGRIMFGSPSNPSDGLIEIEAEDIHNFKERLADIKVPTLVIGGEKDPLYPIAETAAGIPNAKLILYKGVGHLAMMKSQFSHDIVDFLTEGRI